MRLEVVMAANPRVVENVILEVRALARRHGLEVPDVKVVSHRVAGPKTKGAPRRRRSARARRSSS